VNPARSIGGPREHADAMSGQGTPMTTPAQTRPQATPEAWPPLTPVAVVAIPRWLAVTTIALLAVTAAATVVSTHLLLDITRVLAVR
jgi:hypothetical protein